MRHRCVFCQIPYIASNANENLVRIILHNETNRVMLGLGVLMYQIVISLLFLFSQKTLARESFPISAGSTIRIDNPGIGYGSGWLATGPHKKRVVITNWHVCEEDRTKKFYGSKLGEFSDIPMSILSTNFDHDLCALTPVPGTPLRLADRGAVPFEPVYTLMRYLPFLETPGEGQYSGETLDILPYKYIPKFCESHGGTRYVFSTQPPYYCLLEMPLGVSTIKAAPGASGSPIVNKDGEVVGVLNSISLKTMDASYIPYRFLKEFLEQF